MASSSRFACCFLSLRIGVHASFLYIVILLLVVVVPLFCGAAAAASVQRVFGAGSSKIHILLLPGLEKCALSPVDCVKPFRIGLSPVFPLCF